jgi:ABC-type Na+ efflux pump permease subunit
VISLLKNIYHITVWEFSARFKSRSFIFLTFLLPFMVLVFFAFPLQSRKGEKQDAVKLLGLINLHEVQLVEQIQNHINQNYLLDSGSPAYIFMPVSLNESKLFIQMYQEYQNIAARKDSVTALYNQVVATRTDYYTNPRIRDKERLLEKSYQDLILIRDVKSLIENEYDLYRLKLDSVHVKESKRIADSLLHNDILDAYLIIPEDLGLGLKLQYYSMNTDDLPEARRIQKIISEVVIKLKMVEKGLELNLVEEWLKPVRLEKIQLKEGLLKKDYFIQFYVTITTVVFLLIAIFTSGGFLLSSVFKEKNDRTIEWLMSRATGSQILIGKIMGLGIIGCIQIMIWSGIIGGLSYLKFFPLGSIIPIQLNYFFYFQLIYIMGYLFYAAFLIMMGTRLSGENEIQRINTLGPILILILILVLFLIPEEFKSASLNVLVYFPFLTPFLMVNNLLVMGVKNLNEIYILGGGYTLLILAVLYVAGRNFKNILYYTTGGYKLKD